MKMNIIPPLLSLQIQFAQIVEKTEALKANTGEFTGAGAIVWQFESAGVEGEFGGEEGGEWGDLGGFRIMRYE